MKELNSEEVKQIQLSILRKVAEFCETHHITYFLCAGTLLGAIRHQGFIPWDDDIDIMMPRPDYERFRKIFKYENLDLYHFKTMKHYYLPYVKIGDNRTVQQDIYLKKKLEMGVYIDVFPVDGFPDDEKERLLHLELQKKYRKKLLFKIFTFNPNLEWYKRIVLFSIRFFIPGRRIATKINEIAQKFDFNSLSKAGLAVWGYGIHEISPSKVFSAYTEVNFEGYLFKAPRDYHTYLSNVYGDYMELPPEEERKPKHNFKAWIKNGNQIKEVIKK